MAWITCLNFGIRPRTPICTPSSVPVEILNEFSLFWVHCWNCVEFGDYYEKKGGGNLISHMDFFLFVVKKKDSQKLRRDYDKSIMNGTMAPVE